LVLQKPAVEPPPEETMSAEAFLVNTMAKHNLTAKEAAAVDGPFTKKELYSAALRLKGWFG
jgi:hypothetical protein